MSILEVQEINKSFKGLEVIKDISLKVKKGERHVIIGPNGAGKTTLFNCITGMFPIDSGTIKIQNKIISGLPSYQLAHLGLSRTFQTNNLFGNLTVAENIHLGILSHKPYRYGFLKPLSEFKNLNKEAMELLDEWDLTHRSNIKVNDLSYGEKRILEIVLSMATKPVILLLDEPTSGMSPVETKQTTELIKNLPHTTTLLIIEHDMDVIFSIADRITVLHHGEKIMSDTPENVKRSSRIKEIYFGGGANNNARTI